jgi:hypothetical protein
MHPHGPSCLPGPTQRRRCRGARAAERSPSPMTDSDTPVPLDAPGVRTELVERVRREIAAGTYETPDKLQEALERLLDRLEWEAH